MPPAAPDFAFVFRRPFAEQVAFFRGKLGNLVPTATWRDIMRSQHDRAFMVAGAAKADLLADLAAAVDKAISEGESLDAFRRRFGEIVEKRGWKGWTGSESKAGTNWRTRVIYRTNLATSYAAGRLAQLKHSPLWVYRHSGAEHPRLQHKAWDGLTLPADHPFWQTHYPPNGWHCFPADTMVRCDALLGQRAWYDGKMVQFDTRLGHRLTVTANHPVLTGRGWVVAHELQEGDELIGAAGDVDAALRGIVDHEQPPARAEDLFEALAAQRLRVVPVAPDDFYGDALGMKGEIHVAGDDCLLMHVVEAARRELGGECGLDGALHGRIEPADVTGSAAQVPLVLSESATAQDILDGRLGDAEPQGNGVRAGQAGSVEADGCAVECVVARVGSGPSLGEKTLAPATGRLDRAPGHLPGGGAVAQRDASPVQRARDGAPAAPMLLRQLLDANAGKVALDHVVEIRKFDWSGHVYDFTTSTGLIMAGGVLVSNCGCRVVGASSKDAARRLGGNPDYDTPPEGWDARDGKGRMPGIDEGWDYMPGGTAGDALRPFVPRIADDGDLPLACHARGCIIEPGGEKPPMPAPRMASAERLLPAGMAKEWYAHRFLAEFGAKPDEVHLFVDVTGHGLVIAAEMFTNRAGEWKLKNGRERYLLLLADTIRSPDEIWQMVEKRDRGRLRVRRRYVARWLMPGEEVPALTVFEWGRDMWQPITAFQPEEVSYLERRGRLGNREWVRPDA